MRTSIEYEILNKFKIDNNEVGIGYPAGVFIVKYYEKAVEALIELQKKGLLENKDENGFFWILTDKGKEYIDKMI